MCSDCTDGWAIDIGCKLTSQRLVPAVMARRRRQHVSGPGDSQPRAARGPAGGRTPRASACGCIGHSAVRRPQGAALNKYGNSNHSGRV